MRAGSPRSRMSSDAIGVGVLAGEPLRLEGLTSVFDEPIGPGLTAVYPVLGTLEELLKDESVQFLLVDMNSSAGGLQTLREIHLVRPLLRLIVIGPAGNEDLVLDSIVAGARAYLDAYAGPAAVREAIEIVVSGSIWAPRRLLSRLIDRLLAGREGGSRANSGELTQREEQILNLILEARSNREIAVELGIEERTVKAHVGRLMRKMGAENRIDLSMRAIANGRATAPRRNG